MLMLGIILAVFALFWAFTNFAFYYILKMDAKEAETTLKEELSSQLFEGGKLRKVLASIYYWPVVLKIKGA